MAWGWRRGTRQFPTNPLRVHTFAVVVVLDIALFSAIRRPIPCFAIGPGGTLVAARLLRVGLAVPDLSDPIVYTFLVGAVLGARGRWQRRGPWTWGGAPDRAEGMPPGEIKVDLNASGGRRQSDEAACDEDKLRPHGAFL